MLSDPYHYKFSYDRHYHYRIKIPVKTWVKERRSTYSLRRVLSIWPLRSLARLTELVCIFDSDRRHKYRCMITTTAGLFGSDLGIVAHHWSDPLVTSFASLFVTVMKCKSRQAAHASGHETLLSLFFSWSILFIVYTITLIIIKFPNGLAYNWNRKSGSVRRGIASGEKYREN